MNRFVIADANKCIGCRTCEIACAQAHPIGEAGALTPQTFAPRLTVVRSGTITAPVLCRQCDDAPCARACPNKAISQTGDHVEVNQALCIGCKTCVVACPYGAMNVVSVPPPVTATSFVFSARPRSEAQKCDLCAGHAEGPACVATCPTKALYIFDKEALAASQRRRQEQALAALKP